MTLPFRFFIGEFNGYYLRRYVTFLNDAVTTMYETLAYFMTMQFIRQAEVTQGQSPIERADIEGLAIFTGVFNPRLFGRALSTGSFIVLSESHIVNGKQRSERGLLSYETGFMKYVRTERDEYTGDIVEEASPAYRMTVVPSGTPIVGYIWEGEKLYDDLGQLIWSAVHDSIPPSGISYVPFYGESFLTYSQEYPIIRNVPPQQLIVLITVVQRVRYQGVNLSDFMEITELLVGGYVENIVFTPMKNYISISYELNAEYDTEDRFEMYYIWLYVVKNLFKCYYIDAIL